MKKENQPISIRLSTLMLVAAIFVIVIGTLVYILKLQSDKKVSEQKLEKLKQSVENPPYFTNYFPVKYRLGISQEVGQSFRLDSSKSVSGIALKGSYGVGYGAIKVSLFELLNEYDLRAGKKVAEGSFVANSIRKEEEFNVSFTSPVTLNTNQDYVFIVSSENNQTEAGIAFTESDIDKIGKMHEYTILSGGNGEILNSNHSWQPRNSYDVVYRLIK